MGHFACVCRKTQRLTAIQEGTLTDNNDDQVMGEAALLDAVDLIDDSLQPWLAKIKINDTATLLMKVDSGADVLCIYAKYHRRVRSKLCRHITLA